MTISERIVETTAGVRDRAAAYAARAAEAARTGAERAAASLQSAERPVETLADAARQLSTLSHRYATRMLDQGVTTVHGFLAEGTERLRSAAQADDVQTLYRAQLERLPASRERIAKNARETWGIVADTGRELQTLALTTYAHLVGKQAKATRTTKQTRTARTTRTTRTPKKKKSRSRRAA